VTFAGYWIVPKTDQLFKKKTRPYCIGCDLNRCNSTHITAVLYNNRCNSLSKSYSDSVFLFLKRLQRLQWSRLQILHRVRGSM